MSAPEFSEAENCNIVKKNIQETWKLSQKPKLATNKRTLNLKTCVNQVLNTLHVAPYISAKWARSRSEYGMKSMENERKDHVLSVVSFYLHECVCALFNLSASL